MTPADEDYIRSKFREAAISADPFPHLVIREVLPPHTYKEMESSLPHFKSRLKDTVREAIPRQIRNLVFPMKPAEAFFYVSESPEFSKGLESLSKIWHENYGAHIQLIYDLLHSVLVAPRHIEGLKIFFCRPNGWATPPHSHNEQELLNALIYFPTEENWPDQGTILYKKQPNAKTNDDGGYPSRQTLEPVRVVPYIPNCLTAWINGQNTIHGSLEIEGGPARRYFYMTSCRPLKSAN